MLQDIAILSSIITDQLMADPTTAAKCKDTLLATVQAAIKTSILTVYLQPTLTH